MVICTHISYLLTQLTCCSIKIYGKILHFSQLILSLTLPKVKNNGQDEPIPPEPEENTHFTCKFCGDTYGEDKFLQEHIKSVHEKRQQYECTLCDAILLGKDNF